MKVFLFAKKKLSKKTTKSPHTHTHTHTHTKKKTPQAKHPNQ